MRRNRFRLVIALVLATVAVPSGMQRFAGRVLSVTDGDTVIVARGRGQVTIRVFGIDAPEGTQPFGREATALLSARVLNKIVDVDMKNVDTYGRLVASISVGGTDVGEEMVRSGAAWHYAQYSDSARLAVAEREARAARRGLWALSAPQAPWTFRANRQSTPVARGTVVKGEFHGNRESKVLHARGCPQFNCKSCTVQFATVAEAKAAGFRSHQACLR